jgi:hypothetical protein
VHTTPFDVGGSVFQETSEQGVATIVVFVGRDGSPMPSRDGDHLEFTTSIPPLLRPCPAVRERKDVSRAARKGGYSLNTH